MEVLAQAVLTWIHLVAASIWVGGSIFIGIVFPPLSKNHDELRCTKNADYDSRRKSI